MPEQRVTVRGPMQGFLSRDGMSPADLLAAGRAEVAGYGVEFVDDQAAGIEVGFVVRLAGGRALNARRILVATGVRDELPEIGGVCERWARDLLHCPYCQRPSDPLSAGNPSLDGAVDESLGRTAVPSVRFAIRAGDLVFGCGCPAGEQA